MVGSRGKYRERNKLTPRKEGRREERGGRGTFMEAVVLYGANTGPSWGRICTETLSSAWEKRPPRKRQQLCSGIGPSH